MKKKKRNPSVRRLIPMESDNITNRAKAIRCTAPNCTCDCFSPSKPQIRMCDTCGHGWVSHALDKLGFRHLFNCHQVELVQPSIAFDIASLMLYGTQAIPIRLKILLDRLFSVLQHEEVLQVLHGFGWTYEDYARGYILQDATGHVLDRWLLATREEEPLILQQFLRFGETKAIAQQLLLQESSERPEFVVQSPRTDSDIKKFIERTNRVVSTTLLKQGGIYCSGTSSLPLVGRQSLFRQPSSVSSGHSLSPPAGSPVNSSSPMAVSPLNKLQNMQPYDYRRDKTSPETRTSEAPALSVANSTPLSSPTTSIPPVSAVSTLTNHTSTYTVSSDFSGTDGCSEDDTSSAINLSQTSTGYMDSIFAAKKVKHLRKSANPMKRRWNPMVLATLATNPATGKKRVQCHVCLKTFCDKGALKIHFSAVHLREMHKCTVEGCNMMFSSRRSRNRHSANPNPKLHTPNFRRKINPHDGRTANPFPLIPATNIINYNNNILPASGTSLLEGDSSSASDTDRLPVFVTTNSVDTQPSQAPPVMVRSTLADEETALPLTKKIRTEENNVEKEDDMSNCGDEGIDLSVKDPLLSTKGVRKRKSLNPTKCAVTSDDDMQYVSTDDSSSDTYIDQDNDENGLLDSKSDYLSSDGLDSKDDDLDKDDFDDTDEKEQKFETKVSLANSSPPLPPPTSTLPLLPHQPPEAKLQNDKPIEQRTSELDKYQRGVLRNNAQETEDICENPLRHLESLSLGAFTNMVNTNRNHMNHSTIVSSGVSYHAPGLGLATSARPESPGEHNPPLLDHTNSLVPPPLATGPLNSDQDNSLSEQQMPLLPVYRDASIVGSVEIPVDKENPRRCTACGKIFQNHFGVKTHYQNVHLKLMHKCTVEGCNAAFPSKRSRDRHSANLNLHRKLLSTSSEKPSSFFDKSALYPFHPDAAIRGEFFSRLYDPQSLPLSFADLYHSRIPTCGTEGFVSGAPYSNHLAAMPGFHPAFMAPATTTSGPLPDGGSGHDSPASSISSPPSPHTHPLSPISHHVSSVKLEEDLKPDNEGRYSCDICEKKFHESVVLREHYEKCHTQELVQCTEDGCNKVFLSRRTRNLHSDDLHKEKASAAS